MTTIAAKVSTGEIAADTMVSDDETFYSASKQATRNGIPTATLN